MCYHQLMGWGGDQHRRPGNRFIDSVRVRDSEFVLKMGQQQNCPLARSSLAWVTDWRMEKGEQNRVRS